MPAAKKRTQKAIATLAEGQPRFKLADETASVSIKLVYHNAL